MNIKYRRWSLIPIVAIIALLILNPSYADFREFANHKAVHRSINGLVFSIYEYSDEKYLGIAKNFIRIGKRPPSVSDSTAISTVETLNKTARNYFLSSAYREELDTIVLGMTNQGMSDEKIQGMVDSFKIRNGTYHPFSAVAESYYTYLKESGADVPQSLRSFQRTLKTDSLARVYYQYLIKNDFAIPRTYESFRKLLDTY